MGSHMLSTLTPGKQLIARKVNVGTCSAMQRHCIDTDALEARPSLQGV